MEGPAGGDRAKRMKTRNFYKITKRNETWPVGQWRMAKGERRMASSARTGSHVDVHVPADYVLLPGQQLGQTIFRVFHGSRLRLDVHYLPAPSSLENYLISEEEFLKFRRVFLRPCLGLTIKLVLDTIYFRKLKLKGFRKNIHGSLRVRNTISII